MFRPRVIPVLLLHNNALVKTINFKSPKYIGDPINAVRIFNDLNADELVFLDIEATSKKRLISLEFVKNVGEEANMPFAVGGGIRSIEDIRSIIGAGAEKVIISSEAVKTPDFVRRASDEFGSSTIAICMDVKRKLIKGNRVCSHRAKLCSNYDPIEFACLMENSGAGEIIVQSVDKDGQMSGYDISLVKMVSESVSVPVVALGGAGTIKDLENVYSKGFANGIAAGSLFVYQGPKRGVLINYPKKDELSFNS